MPTLPVQVPVAVHRWFEHGADWAFHPDFAPHLTAAMEHLRRTADSRQEHQCPSVAMSNGKWLLVLTAPDPECLNQKAASRHPAITWVACFDAKPDQATENAAAERLGRVMPQRAGVDRSLQIELQFVPAKIAVPGPAPEEPPKGSRRRRPSPIILRSLTAMLAITLLSLLLCLDGEICPTPVPAELTAEISRQLGKWSVDLPKDAPADTIINTYFETLCTGDLLREDKIRDSQHPYVLFTRRLPRTFERPPKWTEEVLREKLENLSRGLRVKVGGRPSELLQRISEAMNYEAWRAPLREKRDKWQFLEPVSPKLCDYVARFRDGSEFRATSDAMRRQLRRWGKEPSADASEFLVMRVFLETVTRPDWLDDCSTEAKQHVYWRIASRMPVAGTSLGWTGDDEEDVELMLKDVLRDLGVPPSGSGTPGLVDAVAAALDYDVRKDEFVLMWRTGETSSNDLNLLIRQFRSNEKQTPD